MRFCPSSILLRLSVGSLALILLFTVGFTPPHRKRKHGKSAHVISAQEARAANARKVQLGHKLHGLHSHMHLVRAKIHRVKVQENQITETIQTVEARLERTQRNLERADAKLELLDTQHQQTERRLEETQKRLALRRQLLSRRIRYNYERGEVTYAQTLVEARSVPEVMSRAHYVRMIIQSDTELIQGVRQDITQIEQDKRRLEAQEREQKALSDEFQAQKEQYAADKEKKRELLESVHQVRVEAEQELDELENESQEMTDRIRLLSEAIRIRREAERRAQRASGRPHHRAPDALPPVWHGGFIRPAGGPITSGFGYRYHPILHRRKLHTGVDFGAGYGAPIHAAGGGIVILASYTRGYGNCVIIDHGNSVTTLYGHCSQLHVSVGDTVSQGQLIGNVGSTGMSTGPHLHFEVRRNGVPVQPF